MEGGVTICGLQIGWRGGWLRNEVCGLTALLESINTLSSFSPAGTVTFHASARVWLSGDLLAVP